MTKEQIVKLAIGNDLKVEVHDIREYLNEVLDKIRAEIQAMPTDYCGIYIGLNKQEVLQIIDKYKAESEE